MSREFNSNTVKLVFTDRIRDQYKCGHYTQVAFIYKFNDIKSITFGTYNKILSSSAGGLLYTGGLYSRFDCTVDTFGLRVCVPVYRALLSPQYNFSLPLIGIAFHLIAL